MRTIYGTISLGVVLEVGESLVDNQEFIETLAERVSHQAYEVSL